MDSFFLARASVRARQRVLPQALLAAAHHPGARIQDGCRRRPAALNWPAARGAGPAPPSPHPLSRLRFTLSVAAPQSPARSRWPCQSTSASAPSATRKLRTSRSRLRSRRRDQRFVLGARDDARRGTFHIHQAEEGASSCSQQSRLRFPAPPSVPGCGASGCFLSHLAATALSDPLGACALSFSPPPASTPSPPPPQHRQRELLELAGILEGRGLSPELAHEVRCCGARRRLASAFMPIAPPASQVLL